MKPGDKVEVQSVWASQGRLREPLRSWFKGYEFVSTDGVTTVVKHADGLYEGIDANYPAGDVRVPV